MIENQNQNHGSKPKKYIKPNVKTKSPNQIPIPRTIVQNRKVSFFEDRQINR